MKNWLIGMFLSWAVGTCLNAYAQVSQNNPSTAQADSIIETYSIEELIKYREYYKDQIRVLEKDSKELRRRGIKDAERFLENNPQSSVLDKVIMRLAELYFQEANDEYLDAMQSYDEQIEELEEKGDFTVKIEEPKKNYSQTLDLYQKIIDAFPQSELYDDALYNKAFLQEDMGMKEVALTEYNYLITEFPDSRYRADALLRIAEYHFNPPVNNIEKAIEIYREILEFKDSPKYNEALYRLGWCYYRLNNYKEAVSYFTLLADDVERAKKLDPTRKFTNPLLAEESIEYIGISFLEKGGAKGAVEYLKSIGGRGYGVEILKKIGDVYKDEKEEYANAISAYELLLKIYPDDAQAPHIQEMIVECYRLMRDDMMTYLSREKLFNLYKPGSVWWQKKESEIERTNAATIAERALRDNINLLYQRAAAANDADLYLQAANDSRKYLKSFPADTNAPQIHWNMALTMDTKMHDYEQAFDEYLKICDLYWGRKYQQYAAENAIALGKDAVAADSSRKKVFTPDKSLSGFQDSSSVLKAITYHRIELRESEKKLARAYDNYIKLFPHEPETADILLNSGALYYNNNQFQEALKYFNTFAKHFPESRDIHYAKYMILESYFGRRDFKSAEIVARKLKNSTTADSTLIAKAKKRLAESIFLAAEVFADSGNYLAAGNEHIRVVREVPDATFGDLSLFKASLEFDKAREFRRAIETYNFLIETKPKSKYFFDAMNNLAIDYGEVGEYKNAALSYERLAYATRDSVRTHDALYNSSIFFVRAEEWENAIRINRKFVSQFPISEDADDLFFDIATYYLKLDELDLANNVYGEYVQAYPNSPRVVETYFHRGEYFRRKNESEKALTEYRSAVQKNSDFKKKNIESNDFFAAEALFNINKLRFEDYRNIEFLLPTAQMEQAKSQKKNLLKELIDGFSDVARFGTLRLYEATFQIGDVYEEFAKSWSRQELPSIEETRKIVLQKEINQTSAELYRRAEKSYKQAVTVLTKLANNYEKELLSNAHSDTRLKIVMEDSTLRVARKWIDRCKEKISEVIYDIAELNFASVNSFLEAPIPAGLNSIAEMEYRKQVLNRAVKPLIDQIVDDHSRNVKEAWTLGIENQWVKLSRSKVISTNYILSSEYQNLAVEALNLYTHTSEIYNEQVRREKSSEVLSHVALAEQMSALIEFGREFANMALAVEKATIEKAQTEAISDPVVTNTKEKMMRFLFDYTQRVDSLRALANMNRKHFETIFKETDDPDYEEAIFTYEDNFFSFKEISEVLLASGYETSQDLALKNKWTTKILLSLIEKDPEQYGHFLKVSIERARLISDNSWLVAETHESGWTGLDFDDTYWRHADMLFPVTEADSSRSIWMVAMDTLMIEPGPSEKDAENQFDESAFQDEDSSSTAKRIREIKAIPSKTVFFRKAFFIEGLPVSAELKIKADNAYNLFLNGEYIAASRADSTEWQYVKSHQLKDYLRTKKNLLAIESIDNDRSGGGLTASVVFKNISNWENIRQKNEIEASDEKVRQNLAVDKYIIVN